MADWTAIKSLGLSLANRFQPFAFHIRWKWVKQSFELRKWVSIEPRRGPPRLGSRCPGLCQLAMGFETVSSTGTGIGDKGGCRALGSLPAWLSWESGSCLAVYGEQLCSSLQMKPALLGHSWFLTVLRMGVATQKLQPRGAAVMHTATCHG